MNDLTQTIQAIQLLPLEAQNLVSEWVQMLQKQYHDVRPKSEETTIGANHPFFGIWSDQEDMKDSVAYIRRLRNEHWSEV